MPPRLTRRQLLSGAAATAGLVVAGRALGEVGAPAILPSPSQIPQLPSGIMSGDVTHDSALIWARADRPSRMIVEVDTDPAFKRPVRCPGTAALMEDDFTARVDLQDLPHDTAFHYRVYFESLEDPRARSEALAGRFRTLPRGPRQGPIRFGWSGDLCGQGYGIHGDRGGLRIFEQLSREALDFFICSGDLIYADNPILPELTLPDGSLWRNETSPQLMKVAEALDEFRARYRYNLSDAHMRAFLARVPLIAQWDDHETTNNWYPGEQLTGDDRYQVRSADLLSARARRAFLEYTPVRRAPHDPERIFRRFRCGPSLDVFVLDLRSYREANPQATAAGAPILGGFQRKWLEQNLMTSRATWKVIACDMPLGLVIPDGDAVDGIAAGSGAPAGREEEIAGLLAFLKQQQIRGLIWLTADVHYAAAHHYHPDRARFKDFDPFWEFVAGPLNAGTFGPNALDSTFGPSLEFLGIPKDMPQNAPPTAGHQFYGTVEVDPKGETLKVRLHRATGEVIYERAFGREG